MGSQKSLSLLHRFEPAHASFSYPSLLVRKLGAIVGVLGSIVNRVGYKFSVSHAVTFQLISDNSPRFISAFLEEPFEKALSSFTISTSLQQNIDHLTVLVYRAPQIPLLTLNPYEYLINEECLHVPDVDASAFWHMLGQT